MIFFNKKLLTWTALACAAVFVCVYTLTFTVNYVLAEPKHLITAVLDAGHGGKDGGASGKATKVSESELNLKIVYKLKNVLEKDKINVVLTRKTENGLYGIGFGSFKSRDMKARKEIINKVKPDIVISIHMNTYPDSRRRGTQVFFDKDNAEGRKLSDEIQKKVNGLNGLNYSTLKGDYFILNCSGFSSALVECGFLSNAEDEALLVSDEYQDKLVKAIRDGIIVYLLRAV